MVILVGIIALLTESVYGTTCEDFLFSDSVSSDCVTFPVDDPSFDIHAKTMVDYQLTYDSSLSMTIPIRYKRLVNDDFVVSEDPSLGVSSNMVGVAIDGVPIYSPLLSDGIDGLQPHPITHKPIFQLDLCGGMVGQTDEGVRYHYRALPTCVFESTLNSPISVQKRQKTALDIHDLFNELDHVLGPRIVGYTLIGTPIYTPFTARGTLQTNLDNCNGKFVNGSYGYYATPSFPYLVGCEGAGTYSSTYYVDALQEQFEMDSSIVMGYQSCPSGHFLSQLHSTTGGNNACRPCPAGRYSRAIQSSLEGKHQPSSEKVCSNVCPIGSFCPEGSTAPQPCPAGRYGSAKSLGTSKCSGECVAGHFCAAGSTTPYGSPCGGATYYCPLGAVQRYHVDAGYYTVAAEGLSEISRSDTLAPIAQDAIAPSRINTMQSHSEYLRVGQVECEVGSYCDAGIRTPCPAGVYGATTRLLNSNCTAPCPPGHYCPEASITPILCAAGRYGSTTGLKTADCSGLCDGRTWCAAGSTSIMGTLCPAGRFGGKEGLKTETCGDVCEDNTEHGSSVYCVGDNICPAGYLCPIGTADPYLTCGENGTVYCPRGSSVPIPVKSGFYSTGLLSKPKEMQVAADVMVRTSEEQCEAGYWCDNAVKKICPSGVYGGVGATSADCAGYCTPGYFCTAGSTSPTQYPCGDASVYCPLGSSTPTQVPAGYYSVGGTTPVSTDPVLSMHSMPTTRSDIVICPIGHYCEGGVMRMCPAGRYTSKEGTSDSACEGECYQGHYCPLASTSRTQIPCPAGRFGGAGLVNDKCQGACVPGYYCPESSTVSNQVACGGDHFYCPAESSVPLPVESGYYSTGGDANTRSGQELCVGDDVLGTPPAASARSNLCPSTTA